MRRETTLGLVVVTLAATGALFAGCASFEADICAYAKCDADGSTADGPTPDGTIPDGSTDATTDRDPPPPGCDTPNDPLKKPEKCLVDAFGVFVSPSGDDANAGTKDMPVKSIGKALSMGRGRLVVCEGTYTESLEIKSDVELYSGVTCDFAKAGGKAKLVASKPEYAVSIAAPANTVRLHSVDVEAIDGTEPSVNSIAMLVSQAQAVTLVNVGVTAKKGFDGKKGDEGTVGAMGDVGNDAMGATPGNGKSKMCNGMPTSGGGGGGAGAGGGPGGPSLPENPAGNSGAGGMAAVTCNGGGFGKDGAFAAPAAPAAKITARGTLTTTWQPARGQDGTTGGPGQGGGGGAGIAGGGGGGGTGGCGGTGGKGGQGGGASIALLSIDAKVTTQGSTLRSGGGGGGGAGGAGGGGGSGGNGGGAGANGCQAGSGGQGGAGGAGSGGAGGISVPIVYKGTKPGGDATLTFGTPGTAGPGGAPGVNDGPEGVAQNELEVP